MNWDWGFFWSIMTRKVTKYGKLQVGKKEISPTSDFWFFNENHFFYGSSHIFSGKVGQMPLKPLFIMFLFVKKCLNILPIGGAENGFTWHLPNFSWKYVKVPIKTNWFSLKDQKSDVQQIFLAHLKFAIFCSFYNWFLSSILC